MRFNCSRTEMYSVLWGESSTLGRAHKHRTDRKPSTNPTRSREITGRVGVGVGPLQAPRTWPEMISYIQSQGMYGLSYGLIHWDKGCVGRVSCKQPFVVGRKKNKEKKRKENMKMSVLWLQMWQKGTWLVFIQNESGLQQTEVFTDIHRLAQLLSTRVSLVIKLSGGLLVPGADLV